MRSRALAVALAAADGCVALGAIRVRRWTWWPDDLQQLQSPPEPQDEMK